MEEVKDEVQTEIKDETKSDNPKSKKKKSYDIESDERYIEKLEEIASLKDQILRKQAEFENFRKRTNEERVKDRKYALNDFLTETIDYLDIFNKACNVTTDDKKLESFLMGFKMIASKLFEILDSYGVKKIETLDKPFDPNFMAAIDSAEVEGKETGIVFEEVLTGYTYKDRVLRVAQVKVTK